jgi:hypothetical protein
MILLIMNVCIPDRCRDEIFISVSFPRVLQARPYRLYVVVVASYLTEHILGISFLKFELTQGRERMVLWTSVHM